jgi:hypothetical protein
MKQNKLFQLWSTVMAKKTGSNSKKQNRPLPQIFIEPTNDETASCPLRIKEIQDLVAEIIILGTKRGRPSRSEEELKDVA